MTEKFIKALQKLNYFQSRIVKIHPPATINDIHQAEEKLGWIFNNEMKEFLCYSSGIGLIEYHIFGVQLICTAKIPKYYDIEYWNFKLRVNEWWPKTWLKLGRDGFGNYLVAVAPGEDKKEVSTCYWVDHENIGTNSESLQCIGEFYDLLNYAIDDTIKYYDPEGLRKNKPD